MELPEKSDPLPFTPQVLSQRFRPRLRLFRRRRERLLLLPFLWGGKMVESWCHSHLILQKLLETPPKKKRSMSMCLFLLFFQALDVDEFRETHKLLSAWISLKCVQHDLCGRPLLPLASDVGSYHGFGFVPFLAWMNHCEVDWDLCWSW